MQSEDLIGIIELGSKEIKCLIIKVNENESEILSSSITPSKGISHDVITNSDEASKAIRVCISNAEKKAKLSLKKINVVFEQPEFLCTKLSKQKKIGGSIIHKDDIDFLLKEAKKQLILNDKNQTIIHIFNYNYIVDGRVFIKEPINIYADTLNHEVSFITAPKKNLENINRVFNDCDMEIERFISRTFALGAQLINHKDLFSGTAIVNLESKKISLGIFKNLALINFITFPIGVDHIINDLAKVCSLNIEESEKIRNDFDFSFQNNNSLFSNNYLKDSYFVTSKFRKISKNLIIDIIKSRLDEFSELIKKQLTLSAIEMKLNTSLLFISKASKLLNIEKYLADFYRVNIKVRHLQDINHIEEKFSECLGAFKIIKDGWETEAIPEISDTKFQKIGFFSKIFGKRG